MSTKMSKMENFDIFDNFGVILRNFFNNKIHMSLLKNLLDTKSLLNDPRKRSNNLQKIAQNVQTFGQLEIFYVKGKLQNVFFWKAYWN